MNDELLDHALAGFPSGALRFFAEIGSTNDEAIRWAEEGAADLSLVIADSQTSGRGRLNRRWITRPGCALAFSLVVRPNPNEIVRLPLFTAAAGLAVSSALAEYGLQAEIKWPNDVLLDGKKVCGILVESSWQGNQVVSVVVGIGVNIAPDSIPAAGELLFPATCVEASLDHPVARWQLLRQILDQFVHWRGLMGEPLFLETWQQRLAFRGQTVSVGLPDGTRVEGTLSGIDSSGAMQLREKTGEVFTIQAGDVHLRPVDH